jgi:hypothetical protein
MNGSNTELGNLKKQLEELVVKEWMEDDKNLIKEYIQALIDSNETAANIKYKLLENTLPFGPAFQDRESERFKLWQFVLQAQAIGIMPPDVNPQSLVEPAVVVGGGGGGFLRLLKGVIEGQVPVPNKINTRARQLAQNSCDQGGGGGGPTGDQPENSNLLKKLKELARAVTGLEWFGQRPTGVPLSRKGMQNLSDLLSVTGTILDEYTRSYQLRHLDEAGTMQQHTTASVLVAIGSFVIYLIYPSITYEDQVKLQAAVCFMTPGDKIIIIEMLMANGGVLFNDALKLLGSACNKDDVSELMDKIKTFVDKVPRAEQLDAFMKQLMNYNPRGRLYDPDDKTEAQKAMIEKWLQTANLPIDTSGRDAINPTGIMSALASAYSGDRTGVERVTKQIQSTQASLKAIFANSSANRSTNWMGSITLVLALGMILYVLCVWVHKYRRRKKQSFGRSRTRGTSSHHRKKTTTKKNSRK